MVHVGIVRQMGRHIIASSCSHYCGGVQAETAGVAPGADAESRPSCRGPAAGGEGPAPLSQGWAAPARCPVQAQAVAVREGAGSGGRKERVFHTGTDLSGLFLDFKTP